MKIKWVLYNIWDVNMSKIIENKHKTQYYLSIYEKIDKNLVE